jgi:type IV pilus assembly protein PilM
MMFPASSARVSKDARAISRKFDGWFPIPKLLTPPSAGIDISDASIKWLALDRIGERFCVHTHGEIALESGIVVSGLVHNPPALVAALVAARTALGPISRIHAALPEEAAYVFGMQVPPKTPREQIMRMIEFEFEGRIPIPPTAAVFDYNPIATDARASGEIGVIVFPQDVSEAYAGVFTDAGFELLSLEVEATSIARAVCSTDNTEPITLLVDFGRARTGFAVIKRGTPIFTSTVEVGGEAITRTLKEKLGLSDSDAERYKNEQGVLPGEGAAAQGFKLVSGTASVLADEVARHFDYWDTRRNEHGERLTPVGKVVLVGGNANLKGLDDLIASRVHAPVEVGDVWRNVAPFDEYIPPIEKRASLQYATSIGLALRGL